MWSVSSFFHLLVSLPEQGVSQEKKPGKSVLREKDTKYHLPTDHWNYTQHFIQTSELTWKTNFPCTL